MESLGKYLLNHENFRDRIFVSNPPGAALLIWSNYNFLPNVSGISIVSQIGNNVNTGIEGKRIYEILLKQIYNTVPVLYIEYDQHLTYMIINGNKLSIKDSADYISRKFSISISNTPAKRPNDLSQIKDPFHLWSREAFDGRTVFKTDIDILAIDTKILNENSKIKSVLEVKRSAKIPVGQWQPYVEPKNYNDSNNYLISMSLCNLLKANFYTIHHDLMDSNQDFQGTEMVDCFVYKPKPDQSTLDRFASKESRKTFQLNQLFK